MIAATIDILKATSGATNSVRKNSIRITTSQFAIFIVHTPLLRILQQTR